jgi:hypothetical protein
MCFCKKKKDESTFLNKSKEKSLNATYLISEYRKILVVQIKSIMLLRFEFIMLLEQQTKVIGLLNNHLRMFFTGELF